MDLIWFALFWLGSAVAFGFLLLTITGLLVELLITLVDGNGGPR